MSDHPETTPHFTITTTPEADAACEAARATMAEVAAELRALKARAQAVVVSLAAHQPADPIAEAINEGRLPATPARDLSAAAELFVEDAVDRCIEIAEGASHATAGRCAEAFSRRQLEAMAAEHRRQRRERGED